MKKSMTTLIALVLCGMLFFTGCFTIDSSRVPRSEKEHVLVGNYGWYLFHYFPLVCGNSGKYPIFPCVMFRNDVTMDKIQSSFMTKAQRIGKTKTSDLTYTTHESVFLRLPGLNIPLPIPYLITYREIQLSGCVETEGNK